MFFSGEDGVVFFLVKCLNRGRRNLPRKEKVSSRSLRRPRRETEEEEESGNASRDAGIMRT